jgi:hypothetical protein
MGENGVMTVADFVTATMDRYRQLSDPVIASMFEVLEDRKSGWITAESAHRELQKCNVAISLEELRKLFEVYVPRTRIGPDLLQVGAYCMFHL